MLSPKMLEHLNNQVQAEMYSSYLYLKLAYEMAKNGYRGFAHWMRCQSAEEYQHALKIADHITDRKSDLELKSIEPVTIVWSCPCDALRAALSHEELVTKRVNEIMADARSENDYAAETLMTWFVLEQIGEEAILDDIIRRLEMLEDDQAGIMFVDKELAKRNQY